MTAERGRASRGDVAAAVARVVAGLLGAALLVPVVGAVSFAVRRPSPEGSTAVVALVGLVTLGLPALTLLGLATINRARGLSSRRGTVVRWLAALAAVGEGAFVVARAGPPGAGDLGLLLVAAALVTVAADRPWRAARRPRSPARAGERPRPLS